MSMFSVVLTNVKNQSEAKAISEALISERLAACANVIPNVGSVYLWKGKVERCREVMLLLKTSDNKLDKLMARLKKLHSYEVPELIVLRIERGLTKYLKWMKESLD